MNAITFGDTELAYSVRLSTRAGKKRIELTPFSIDVIAPVSTSLNEIQAFMKEKVKDVFVAQEKLKAKSRSFLHETDQFFSGGKVSFRGRRLAVRVSRGDVEKAVVAYKSRFFITLPRTVPDEEKEALVRDAVNEWLRMCLLQDAIEIANELGNTIILSFKAVRVREQKHIWATCGKDGILYINRQLIKVPRKVLEYVIGHELAHLTYRNHSDAFWLLVQKMVPDYKAFQDMLDGY